MSKNIHKIIETLDKIAKSIDKLNPIVKKIDENILNKRICFIWNPKLNDLKSVKNINRVDMELLVGIDQAKETLINNTTFFAKGLPSNNVLLWGSRGMGKSSLVKSVHFKINKEINKKLILIEVQKNDLDSLPLLINNLSELKYKFIIFCDDLSFEDTNNSYKSLKTILEGGLEGKPENIILYATSNRRHLMPRFMMENEADDSINKNESVDEKV